MFKTKKERTNFTGTGNVAEKHSERETEPAATTSWTTLSVSSKGSFICIIPQRVWYMAQPLLHQLCSTGWNENSLMGPP